MGVAGVGIRQYQPAGNVHHKPTGIVGRPLANQKRRHQLGFLVDAGPQVNVALVVAFFPFGHSEPRLLLGNVGPLLIELQVAPASDRASWHP